MACSVRIARIGDSGVPIGPARLYEADSERDAVTIAAYEIDAGRRDAPGIAAVSDTAGRRLFTSTGCVGVAHA